MGRTERIKIEIVPKLFDVVELLVDNMRAGLRAGAVGTIVDELAKDAYLVEFSDENGRTLALEALTTGEFAILT